MNALTSHPNPMLRTWDLGGRVEAPSLFYRISRRWCQGVFLSAWRLRVFDRCHEPTEGSVVYISNHQSFMDPPLMAMALKRPVHFMARDSLFGNPAFSLLIESVNAFPVRRGKADLGALKEGMRRLKRGGQVVVFAEGTRTPDGRIAPFLPGVALLAQRAAKWTVPVLIDGAYEIWPKGQALPSLGGTIVVRYARPIPQAEARKQKPVDFVASVRQMLIGMQHDVRRSLGRSELEYE